MEARDWGEKIDRQQEFTFIKEDELPQEQLSLEDYQHRAGLFSTQSVELNDNEAEVFADYIEKRSELLGLTSNAFEAEQSVYDAYGKYAFGSLHESGRLTNGGSYTGGVDLGGMKLTVLDSNGCHVKSRRQGDSYFLGAPERYGLTKPSLKAIKTETELDQYVQSADFRQKIGDLENETNRAVLTDLVRMGHPLSVLNLVSAYRGLKEQLDTFNEQENASGHVFAYRFMRSERSKGNRFDIDTFSEFIIADDFEIRKIENTSTVWNLGLVAVNATSVRFDYTKHHTKERSRAGKTLGRGNWTSQTTQEQIEVDTPRQHEQMLIGPIVGGVENLSFSEIDGNLVVRSGVLDGISNPAKLSESLPIARQTSVLNVRWDQIAAPAGVTGMIANIEGLPEELPEDELTARKATRKAIEAHQQSAVAV